MFLHTSACTAILFAVSAVAQKLNPWPQHNYGGFGRYTDGDITTTKEEEYIPAYGGGRFLLLFNHFMTLSGLYIQSSGDDFITNYHTWAVIGDNYAHLDVSRCHVSRAPPWYAPFNINISSPLLLSID